MKSIFSGLGKRGIRDTLFLPDSTKKFRYDEYYLYIHICLPQHYKLLTLNEVLFMMYIKYLRLNIKEENICLTNTKFHIAILNIKYK